jgi:leucyl/phenylalanyl-tRNA--protein transferase
MLGLPFFFAETADETGLVAVGGDLRPERLLQAYRAGVFPWYGEGEPICWWSPDPRAIFELDGLHISGRLKRTLRAGRFQLSIDRAFVEVIEGCARGRAEGTWITAEMIAAYTALHRRGYAHSIEVWSGEELAGGLYGVAVGGLFAAESMFSRRRDASKIALVHLVDRLRRRGFQLLDIQLLTEHTARLGAIEIPRTEYLARVRRALRSNPSFASPLIDK